MADESSSGKKKPSASAGHKHSRPQWAGRDVTDLEHGHELDREAALHEFDGKLPRHEAEDKAYHGYKRKQHELAAAHHLQGIKMAEAAGDERQGRKHGLMYQLHLKELGHDAIGPVPKEVQQHIDAGHAGEGGTLYNFKPHRGDMFVLDAMGALGKNDKEKVMADDTMKLDWERHEDNSGGYLEHMDKSERVVYRTWEVPQGARPSKHVLVKHDGFKQTTLGYSNSRDEALAKAANLVKEAQQLSLTPLGTPQTAKADNGGLDAVHTAMGKADGSGLARIHAAMRGAGTAAAEGSASASSASASMSKGSLSASGSASSASSMGKASASMEESTTASHPAGEESTTASHSASKELPPWMRKAEGQTSGEMGNFSMSEKCAKCGSKAADCRCGNLGKSELCRSCGKASNLCKCSCGKMGKTDAEQRAEAQKLEKAEHDRLMAAGAEALKGISAELPATTVAKGEDLQKSDVAGRLRNLYVAAKFLLDGAAKK